MRCRNGTRLVPLAASVSSRSRYDHAQHASESKRDRERSAASESYARSARRPCAQTSSCTPATPALLPSHALPFACSPARVSLVEPDWAHRCCTRARASCVVLQPARSPPLCSTVPPLLRKAGRWQHAQVLTFYCSSCTTIMQCWATATASRRAAPRYDLLELEDGASSTACCVRPSRPRLAEPATRRDYSESMNEERARARQARPSQARRSSLCPRAPTGNEKNVAWAAGDILVVAALRRLRPTRLLFSVSRATL